ncbi:MAG: PAS domain-containing sensor histidine kinase [Cystobacter sp.]
MRQARRRILELWEERVRRGLPAARSQHALALLDTLPGLLDQLADTLSRPSSGRAHTEVEGVLSVGHGQVRAHQREDSLEQVLIEYQVLRQVILEVLEAEHPLAIKDRDVILDGVQAGVRYAAVEFTWQRNAEREDSAVALQRTHGTLESLVQSRTSELASSEERLVLLTEGVQDYALFTADAGGLLTSWNPGAERMTGYTAGEILGRHYSSLYPREGQLRGEPEDHLRLASTEGRFRGEGLRQRKNGEGFLTDVLITPMLKEGRLEGFSLVVQDLTERNLLIQERDLSRSDVEALKMDRGMRERFVLTLTHDLRSPLAAAKTGAGLILRAPENPEKVQVWAGRISDAVDRMDRMISDLLDTNRLVAGEPLPMEFGPCDLADVARAVEEELSSRHGDRFLLETRGETQGVWNCAGLRRVLENLISNAVKYGHPTAPITTRLSRVENRMRVAIHNQGNPISPEDQLQLFMPFHRTSSAQHSEQKGWGLGLSLVRGLVLAHQGTVTVESHLREGTTFTVDLPVDARPAS